ncbi:glucose/arabinose dehydrogenase [Pedobacter cryoconitis]|uniref:Glucose/arabinose dehydrogenase n=1 Tax=Pedobacter cryoconitis TaxID=188932 RepID=A0A7W9DYD2_9SPHI|nr:PQQ-dependent sugar dehydrogenase [Pedobacter cryoconitis]MBB5634420.1 glucose/arabinose dehydrogenase [Pedobacter cryoconitis]MBB6272455.1 glucose/arabinose dehydrogenase [Pedobacter cryoconitis]
MMRSTYKKVPVLCATLIPFVFACSSSYAQAIKNKSTGGTNPPVETQAANSKYKPAFAGQTRIAGVKTKTPYTVTLLSKTLEHPWGLCLLPDGRFLISEKMGTMSIVTTAGKVVKKITGLPAVVPDGQGGLLDVNIDPQFATNKMIYWAYSEQVTGGTLLAIAKGKLSADESKVEHIEVIYRATPAYKGSLQFGSRIVFDKNGNLFVSTGERSGADIRMQAQSLNSSLGKIIHITKNGKPVPGGPFAKTAGSRPEIYAYGFRNPEGLALNPATGELWESEFGPRGGDEINIIRPGKNYGWPVITYGIEYSGEKVGDGIQQKEGMQQPVYYWDPVVSPAGIAFYNSNVIPEWKGNLFVGGLSSMHIARLVIKNNKVIGEERLLKNEGERFRALAVGKDGALYAVTDGGKFYRVAKK